MQVHSPSLRGRLVCFTAITLLLLKALVSLVDGQSGRNQPQPRAGADQPTAALVLDPKRDEYQLSVSKISEAEKANRKLGSWDRQEHHVANFSDDLTRVGAQGYRLISIAVSPRVAVFRRADHRYEYAVVDILTRRQASPNDPQFALTYEPWARKGFRVADYFVFRDWCENDAWNDGILAPADCSYSSTVVLERRFDAKLPHTYDIVNGPLTFSRKKLEGELLEELDDGRTTNLYPTHMLTKSQLLRQSPSSVDDVALAGYDIEIVSGDMRKRTNALAQQGYRLIIRALSDAAVMHRKKGVTDAASYIWVREKNIEQELARLQEQGAMYRMNYGCRTDLGDRSEMIFEQPSVRDGTQREYKVLALELKNETHELKRLTGEGFEVRDLFDCHLSDKKNKPSRVKILLERVR